MELKINLKSAAVGIVVGAAAALCIGAATAQSPAIGRYRLTVFALGQLVLKIDTSTGQVWSSTLSGRGWATFAAPNAEN